MQISALAPTMFALALLLFGKLNRATTTGSQATTQQVKLAPLQVGDRLRRIACPKGYAAYVFATDLAAPDGLALDTQGRLVVAEESKGRITRIGKRGKHTTLAKELRSPEGICITAAGELFAIEDTRGGRLFSIGRDGEKTVLVEDLDAPEGILLVGDSLYVTESTAQYIEDKFAMKTRLIRLTRDTSRTGWSEPRQLFERGLPLSLSELVSDENGHILIANEIAGGLVAAGLMCFDPESGKLESFCSGLISPEGLAWSADGGWPLFVAEEDIDGKGAGRLSTVSMDGQRTTFASGFGTLEDVLVAPDGRIFVSEDSSGQIIELRPEDWAGAVHHSARSSESTQCLGVVPIPEIESNIYRAQAATCDTWILQPTRQPYTPYFGRYARVSLDPRGRSSLPRLRSSAHHADRDRWTGRQGAPGSSFNYVDTQLLTDHGQHASSCPRGVQPQYWGPWIRSWAPRPEHHARQDRVRCVG